MARHDLKNNTLPERAARGEYELVDPLDYLILDKLQPEGTLFAGLYPLGDTVKALGAKFDQVKGGLTGSFIVARLRPLRLQGLVVPKNAGSSTRGKTVWQRTARGTEVLTKWKETNSGNS